ncbi:MAG: hypothetical protein AAF721_36670 [Myxococcota bacterium]
MWCRSLALALVTLAGCGEPLDAFNASATELQPEAHWTAQAFVASGAEIPTEQTSYVCHGFSIDTPQPSHLVAFEPRVDGAEVTPHHMVLYRLSAPPPSERWDCLDMPAGAIAYFGWAPGTEALALPDAAGFLMGDDGTQTHFALQIHYENPAHRAGLVDDSGIVAWSTEQIREYDAGILTLGTVAALEIPAGQAAFEHTNRCLTSTFPEPLEVFGAFVHGHALLRRIWTDQFREGERIGALGRDDAFRFDLQRYRPLDGRIVPGDHLVTHCVYDSTERDAPTFGGEGADAEMCLNSLFYYPRTATQWCGS